VVHPTPAEWVTWLRSQPSSRGYGVIGPEGMVFDTYQLADLIESLDNPKELDRDTMATDAADPNNANPPRQAD